MLNHQRVTDQFFVLNILSEHMFIPDVCMNSAFYNINQMMRFYDIFGIKIAIVRKNWAIFQLNTMDFTGISWSYIYLDMMRIGSEQCGKTSAII
jgi:hypothetical protein